MSERTRSGSSVTPLDVRFAADDAIARPDRDCPACGRRTNAKPVLAVPSLAPPHAPLELLRCGSCASVHFDPPGIRDFSDLGATHEGFWRFYAETGGGVWETIWPLVAARDKGSLLDVGCGFGFALDFWQSTARGDATGVELAGYGRVGARQLGVTIHAERLEDCDAVRNRRFDIVYASEVIEHVEDPRAFCALLARFVADDGVLVMTTPAAEFITPEERGVTQLTALAPGFHGFLMSAAALERALRDAGFPIVEVRRFHERQVAWASRRAVELDLAEPRMRASYFDYMASRLATFDASSPIGLGYAYRLLRDFANTGRMGEARDVERRLRAAIASAHGDEALDPARACARYAKAQSLDDLGRAGPYFLPCYFHFAATVAQHASGDAVGARTLYAAAMETARLAAGIGVVHLPEASAIYWSARIAEATLALALGDDSGAVALAEMADAGERLSADHAFGTVSPAQIESLLPAVAEELMARNRWAAACTIADAYRRYVVARYGIEATTTSVVAREHVGAAPTDPLFVPFFDVVRRFREERSEAAEAEVAAFVASAEAVQGRLAVRAHALAARARPMAGLPKPAPAFAFEMSFTLKPPGR